MRNPRFEKEDDIAPLESPDINAVQCKDCAFRAEDVKIGGMEIPGATKGSCKAFEYKPYEIIFKGETCPYYMKQGSDA